MHPVDPVVAAGLLGWYFHSTVEHEVCASVLKLSRSDFESALRT